MKADAFPKAFKFSNEYINRKASIANTNRQQPSQLKPKSKLPGLWDAT